MGGNQERVGVKGTGERERSEAFSSGFNLIVVSFLKMKTFVSGIVPTEISGIFSPSLFPSPIPLLQQICFHNLETDK